MNFMRGAVALLTTIATTAVVGLLLALFCGGITRELALAAMVAGTGAGVLAARVPIPGGCRPRGWVVGAVLVVFALFALRGFCWVLYERGNYLGFLTPHNLGDISLHITLIRYLASGVSFWPDSPILAAEPLHYPFGMDWINSLLLVTGLDLIPGLVWAGLIGSALTGVLLWRWGGAFAVAGFLFNGGFAAWHFWQTGEVNDFQKFIEWKSIPLAMFITQRGLLYAIPAGLLLLWSWRERFFRKQPGLPLAVEALIYGTLPLFHLHTFLFLSWMLGAWGVMALLERNRDWLRQLLTVVGAAFIPATLLIWKLTGGFASGSAIHWKPGWMQGDQSLLFWVENFGILPFLVAALLFRFWKKRGSREEIAMVVPATLLFLIACFVMFAAWEWDNTKIFLWCYLAILPALWSMIRQWPLLHRVGTCVLLFLTGAAALLDGLTWSSHRLVNRTELDTLAELLRPLPVTGKTFAAVPTYNHPLLLIGQKCVMGYAGHLRSYGIDYRPTQEALFTLVNGREGWEKAAAELKADYLFWGTLEKKAHSGEEPRWMGQLPVVAESDWGTIYDLSGVRHAHDAPATDDR